MIGGRAHHREGVGGIHEVSTYRVLSRVSHELKVVQHIVWVDPIRHHPADIDHPNFVQDSYPKELGPRLSTSSKPICFSTHQRSRRFHRGALRFDPSHRPRFGTRQCDATEPVSVLLPPPLTLAALLPERPTSTHSCHPWLESQRAKLTIRLNSA